MRAGQVSFHHPLTFHGSGPNTSDRMRRSLAVHFVDASVTAVSRPGIWQHYNLALFQERGGAARRAVPTSTTSARPSSEPMGKVIAGFSMSLDGFIASPEDLPDHIFDWYEVGDVRFDWPGNDMVSQVTPASAAYLKDLVEGTGALVVGRRIFDITDGWGGRHPIGAPVFVVSHRGPEGWDERHDPSLTTFVNSGVADAIAQAQAVAGDKAIGVAGPNIAQQCLDLGLLDEIRVELAPVVLGAGIPFFAHLQNTPVVLDNPTVIESDRVTHLIYSVRK